MPISSKKSLTKLNEELSSCKKCINLVKSKYKPFCGRGAPNSRLMVVSFSPEDMGLSAGDMVTPVNLEGSLLISILRDCKLSLENDTYLTFIIKCVAPEVLEKPAKPGGKKDGSYKSHVNNCINFLTEEISVITPHIIVSLGLDSSNIILENFFGMTKKFDNMGKLHMRIFENPSFKLVPFFSPSAIMEGLISETSYIEDFKKLSKIIPIV